MKKPNLITIYSIPILVLTSGLITLSSCQLNTSSNALLEPSVTIATEIPAETSIPVPQNSGVNQSTVNEPLPPLYIDALREREYPASQITIEQTLDGKENFQRYIASYQSDGNRIYGLLTIPDDPMPEGGYPVILILHGYIPPDIYNSTVDYATSQDALARSGFLTFKPDMRGHGRSEGDAIGAHFSEAYIVDSLNALSALQAFEQVNPTRIGIWGHSNGGLIGLRMAVITNKIKASVLWAGVVGSYEDMLETYYERIDFLQRLAPPVIEEFGLPSENPDYWMRIDPYAYLDTISAPVQLHHGIADSSVPVELSISLYQALRKSDKTVELFQYEGMGHNFYGQAFNEAMQHTVEFFMRNLSE